MFYISSCHDFQRHCKELIFPLKGSLTVLVITALLTALFFSVTSNLINYFPPLLRTWSVKFGWMKPRCQVLAKHQLPADSRGGDGDADWLGGRITPSSRCLTAALTAKHNKTETMATSQGNLTAASSNWKYRLYFWPILIKAKSVSVTASSNSNLMKKLTSTHAGTFCCCC